LKPNNVQIKKGKHTTAQHSKDKSSCSDQPQCNEEEPSLTLERSVFRSILASAIVLVMYVYMEETYLE
jgi:hypothetical protein